MVHPLNIPQLPHWKRGSWPTFSHPKFMQPLHFFPTWCNSKTTFNIIGRYIFVSNQVFLSLPTSNTKDVAFLFCTREGEEEEGKVEKVYKLRICLYKQFNFGLRGPGLITPLGQGFKKIMVIIFCAIVLHNIDVSSFKLLYQDFHGIIKTIINTLSSGLCVLSVSSIK